MRIVEAAGKDVCRVLNAATDSSWEPCRVQRGDVEVVPVAIIKVEYETEVVEEGVTGLMVTLLRPSSRPVAEPRTSSKWSDGYSLKPSSIGTKALDIGRRSGLARVRGAPIFQKKWVEGETRVTL